MSLDGRLRNALGVLVVWITWRVMTNGYFTITALFSVISIANTSAVNTLFAFGTLYSGAWIDFDTFAINADFAFITFNPFARILGYAFAVFAMLIPRTLYIFT